VTATYTERTVGCAAVPARDLESVGRLSEDLPSQATEASPPAIGGRRVRGCRLPPGHCQMESLAPQPGDRTRDGPSHHVRSVRRRRPHRRLPSRATRLPHPPVSGDGQAPVHARSDYVPRRETIAARSQRSRRPDPVIDRRGHRVDLAVARTADQRWIAGALERCQSRIGWSASRLTTWPGAAHPRLVQHPSGEQEGPDGYRGRSREHCR
jgi:hypothetical protein